MRFVFTFLLLLLAPLMAEAQPHCHVDKIISIDGSGQYMSIGSGWRLQVFPGQRQVAEFWLPEDRVNVCEIGGAAVSITNFSERGKQVRALRLF